MSGVGASLPLSSTHTLTNAHTHTHSLVPQLQALPSGLHTLGRSQGDRWARRGRGRDEFTRPGSGDRGTLFRGDLQVQVMQKSIKEARQSLPLADARACRGREKGRRGDAPPNSHLYPSTPTLTTGPRGLCYTKQARVKGPDTGVTAQQRGGQATQAAQCECQPPGSTPPPCPQNLCLFAGSGLLRAPGSK